MWLQKASAITFLVVGIFLLVPTFFVPIYWVFNLEKLSKKPSSYWKTSGLRAGLGSFFVMIAYLLFHSEMLWLLPYAVLASVLWGLSAANNLRIQQKGSQDMYLDTANNPNKTIK